jgi:hypothetical protein
MAGGSADFMDQRTWPFLVLHAREQAERYLPRLSIQHDGWRSQRTAFAPPPGTTGRPGRTQGDARSTQRRTSSAANCRGRSGARTAVPRRPRTAL